MGREVSYSRRSWEASTALRTFVQRGWLRLATACAVIGLVWLVLLPWVAARPAVEARSKRLKAQGIDPSAMYYTELPMMERVLERLEGAERDVPDGAGYD